MVYIALAALVVATQGFRILDSLIKMQKPYYAVHVIHNLGIVALTWPDLVASFTGLNLPVNWPAIILCYALHIYHIIDYYRVFRYDDWLHHGLMMGLALPLGCVIHDSGALIGANLFFTTGLPGAISYSLLFAERNGLMVKARVQSLNKAIHLWLRAPGCVAQATLTVFYLLNHSQSSDFKMASGFLIAALTAWNGLYFMEQAIRSESGGQAVVRNNDRANLHLASADEEAEAASSAPEYQH